MPRLSKKAQAHRTAVKVHLHQLADELRDIAPWRASWLDKIARTIDSFTNMRSPNELRLELLSDCEAHLEGHIGNSKIRWLVAKPNKAQD